LEDVIRLMLAADSIAPPITLVEDGRSLYAIAVASDAAPPVRFAAEELQKYVKAISGAVLPIRTDAGAKPAICLRVSGEAESALRARGEDAYTMRCDGRRVELIGNSPRATLYAVYHFLEKYLGCGWCAPGDDTVPKAATIRLPCFDDAIGPPAFSMRQIILFPYNAELLTKNNIPHTDWLAKNRMNWAHPAPNAPYVWERCKSREVGGHTFNTWVPRDRYAAEHPDYFAITKNGSRAMDGTHNAGLCLSNPEVANVVAGNMIGWLARNPEVDAVDLWHNDSHTYCHCTNCTPPGLSGTDADIAYTQTYIRFANAVADRVARRYPKVLINFLSYFHTMICPPDAPRLHDNILVGLCLYPRPSQRTMRPIETSPQPLDSKVRPQLAAWPKVAKHFYVYEYYTIGEKHRMWSMVSMIHEDLKYFRSLGIQGISSDQWGPGWYPLNMYAFARLTWNPDLARQEIIADFCKRYYGKASEPMMAYWNLLEEGLRESWNTDKPVDWHDTQRVEVIKKAFAQADSGQVTRRIRDMAALHHLAIP
jgi:hypothetical protein